MDIYLGGYLWLCILRFSVDYALQHMSIPVDQLRISDMFCFGENTFLNFLKGVINLDTVLIKILIRLSDLEMDTTTRPAQIIINLWMSERSDIPALCLR